MSIFSTTFKTVLYVVTGTIRWKREINHIQIGKEVKLSLFTHNVMLYIEKTSKNQP